MLARLWDNNGRFSAPLVRSQNSHFRKSTRFIVTPAGAVIVNVSRGGLIDEEALAQALESGRISGAGLDVFESEPVDPDSAIMRAPNTILTPHAAFYSNRSLDNLQRLAAEEADRFLKSEKPRNPVN